MPCTKRGIYHNLYESKYVASNSDVTFYFSSRLYLNKFIERYSGERIKFKNKIKPINTNLNMDILSDINLYKEIEKRGFRVTLFGTDIDWNELNKYALRKMNENKTLNWEIIKAPSISERINMNRKGEIIE